MKQLLLRLTLLTVLSLLVGTISSLHAQVGINTTSPSDGAMLDIESGDKGILIPRVNIANLSTIAPITGGSTESLLVYNTNNGTGKGFHYWNGSLWVALSGDFWKMEGNTGTDPGVTPGKDFIGTTDSEELIIATDGTAAITIDTDQQIQAGSDGAAGTPTYSFDSDKNTGIWRSSGDKLNLTAGSLEFIELNENNSQDELTINDGETDMDIRIATTGNENTFYVNGENDNIGIGTDTPNGVLDMSAATTMGMIPPTVELTSTMVEAPVINPQGGGILAGTCVYNTNTAGTAPTNVAPGLYFWEGTRWVAFAGSPGGLDWTLTGNSGTTAGTNYIGTSDAVALVMSTDATERMRIESSGIVGVNTPAPFSNVRLSVTGNGDEFGQYTQVSGAGDGLRVVATGSGTPVYAYANAAAKSMAADNDNATGNGLLAAGAGAPLYAYTGLGSGVIMAGTYGGTGIGTASNGTGFLGAGNARTMLVTDTRGSGLAGSGNALGVYGYAGFGDTDAGNYGNAGGRFSLDADDDITTDTGVGADRAQAILAGFNNLTPDGVLGNQESYFGGYFSGGNQATGASPSYAYAGLRYNTNADGTSGTDFKIIGTGSNSTIIKDENNTPRIMFSPEAPEIVFQDYGVGELVNGVARINLDPTLMKNIRVDAQHPMKVFVTLEGDCNGIYVTDKSAAGFTVKELQRGTSSVAFSWQIVANREDTKNLQGNVTSKHVGLRLPVAPGPIKNQAAKSSQLTEQKDDANLGTSTQASSNGSKR